MSNDKIFDAVWSFLIIVTFAISLSLSGCRVPDKAIGTQGPDAKRAVARFVLCMLEPAPALVTSGADAQELKYRLIAQFVHCMKVVVSDESITTTTVIDVEVTK